MAHVAGCALAADAAIAMTANAIPEILSTSANRAISMPDFAPAAAVGVLARWPAGPLACWPVGLLARWPVGLLACSRYQTCSIHGMANFEEKKTDQKEQLMGEEALNKIRGLLKHFRSAMFTTVTAIGAISTRPMGVQGDPDTFEGTLWFFADARSPKAKLVQTGAQTALILQSDDKSAYLHMSGRASVERNITKMRELETPMLKTWFPDGLEDPNLTLIRFDTDKVDYWESPGGTLQVMGAFAKAVITGEPGAGGTAGTANLP